MFRFHDRNPDFCFLDYPMQTVPKEKWILVNSVGQRVAPATGTFESEAEASKKIPTLTESVKQGGVRPKQLLEG